MSKEVTNQDIFRAIMELSASQSNLEEKFIATEKNLSDKIDATEKRLSDKIDTTEKGLNHKIDVIEQKLSDKMDKTKAEIKEDIHNVEKKVDLVDSQFGILAGSLNKTQAEVRVLQGAKS